MRFQEKWYSLRALTQGTYKPGVYLAVEYVLYPTYNATATFAYGSTKQQLMYTLKHRAGVTETVLLTREDLMRGMRMLETVLCSSGYVTADGADYYDASVLKQLIHTPTGELVASSRELCGHEYSVRRYGAAVSDLRSSILNANTVFGRAVKNSERERYAADLQTLPSWINRVPLLAHDHPWSTVAYRWCEAARAEYRLRIGGVCDWRVDFATGLLIPPLTQNLELFAKFIGANKVPRLQGRAGAWEDVVDDGILIPVEGHVGNLCMQLIPYRVTYKGKLS